MERRKKKRTLWPLCQARYHSWASSRPEIRAIVDTPPCFANLDANRGDSPHSSVRKPAAHVLLYADDPRLAWPLRHDAALAALAARSARQALAHGGALEALCVGSGKFACGSSCPGAEEPLQQR
ncbi:hypothetical protein JG687_00009616 [Phytophthora cactorum]|uniref:Uncharacterized protein n=1 Tax=Phytophthora cactorum TaxID=29920 RepID=A0A8T1UBN6_9STRA|nr:hypothetical protein JG687_00009616 [Phytophthora cactorum]